MCGVAGMVDPRLGTAELQAAGERFADRLGHRGPDAHGVTVVADHSLVLAHTRLSIIDPSAAAAQPMADVDGRFLISYNGEIYNHRQLRHQLGTGAGPFRGHGDTETLLAAIGAWGLRRTLQRSRGMFALAVFDHRLGTIALARDRFGQKPLYHGRIGDALVFTSDLNALGPLRMGLDVDRVALHGYLRTGAVPGNRSIFEGLAPVPPGAVVTYRRRGSSYVEQSTEHYWRLEDEVERSLATPFSGSIDEAVDELDRLLAESVELRMLADVPIGSLLSGGVDSTLVTALMQRSSSRPVKTFTAAFPGHDLDESTVAVEIGRHLGTEQEVLEVAPGDLMTLLPELSAMNGEPFADASQIPTYLICRHARRSVTVCLAGDGGDELFGGYPWQQRAARLVKALRPIPPVARRMAAGVTAAVGRRLDPERARKAGNLALALAAAEPLDARLALTGVWKPGSVPLQGGDAGPDPAARIDWPALPEVEQQMLWYDAVSFLPDLVLTKVDRASMWASLEARAPLLDHEVAAFAWTLPTWWRIGPQSGPASNKWILRRLLDRYVPRELMERPKQGFDVPIGHWLRHDLRSWAGDLLSPHRLEADGFLDAGAVSAAWDAHRTGRADHASRLWTVLMFQAWLERVRADIPIAAGDRLGR